MQIFFFISSILIEDTSLITVTSGRGDQMLNTWLIEIAKGIGQFFINPLFYWTLLFILFSGYIRMKRERRHFGSRVFAPFSEWKQTGIIALLSGLFISIVLLGIGLVFSYETIIILIIVMIVLSLTFHTTMLSPSYTVGFTYLILIFLPYVWEELMLFKPDLFSATNFTGLAIILGLFLMVEGILIRKVKRNDTYPSIIRGKRGGWIGQHHLKKISMIPFFILVPGGLIAPIAPYWPLLTLGDQTYGLILFPFLIGFDFKVTSELPTMAAKRIGKNILLLSILVLAMGVGSIYLSWLSFVASLVAILGREIINVTERFRTKHQHPYFYQEDDGLKILSIIPGTPADRLDVYVGEKIKKVNGTTVRTPYEFYSALQNSGSFFKIEVLDDAGELRFIQSPLYEGDHHELGFVFTSAPYREK